MGKFEKYFKLEIGYIIEFLTAFEVRTLLVHECTLRGLGCDVIPDIYRWKSIKLQG